jgi:uncharacterized protein
MKWRSSGVFAGVVLSFVACGGGKVGETLRPKETTAQTALGEQPSDGSVEVKGCSASFAEPLVVDIKSSDRSDFEVAMKDGVAVVRFDCRTLKLLKNCSYHAAYSFVGVQRNEDVVRMNSKDEVSANMPISGAKLSAEMKSGSTLDLALITVGKRRTTVREVLKKDLDGDCEGATHVVRGAYVGAFAMGTGTVGQAKAVAEIFGAGAAAGSVSDRQASSKSGDIEACRKSSPDAPTPPEQCGAITRLELMPLAQRRRSEEEAKKDEERGHNEAKAVTCSEGMVWTGDKCAPKGSASAKATCAPNDGPDCEAKCESGNAASCVAGRIYYGAMDVAPDGKTTFSKDRKPDYAKVERLLGKACDLGHGDSCSDVALYVGMAMQKAGKPAEERNTKLKELYKRGCDAESATGCVRLGESYTYGTPEPAKALAAYDRGCKLGSGYGCALVGRAYLEGKLATRDPAKALEAFDRACASGRAPDAFYCYEQGRLYAEGKDVAKDANKAMAAWERGCKLNNVNSCYALGKQYQDGDGVAKDAGRARGYYERACSKDVRGWPTCYALGDMHEKGDGVPKNFAKAAEAFELIAGYKDARARAAALYEKGGPELKPDPSRANDLWITTCRDTFDAAIKATACPKAEAIVTKKGGKDAVDFWAARCNRSEDAACVRAKKLGYILDDFHMNGVASRCRDQKIGASCKAWKELGGNPTAAELKYPMQPKSTASSSNPLGLAPPPPPMRGGPATGN